MQVFVDIHGENDLQIHSHFENLTFHSKQLSYFSYLLITADQMFCSHECEWQQAFIM